MAAPRPLVLKHKRATLERIEKYISPIYFADVNLFAKVDTKVVQDPLQISLCNDRNVTAKGLHKCNDWSLITTGATFKPLWSQHWVRITATVPLDKTWHLFWDVGGAESLVVDRMGKPLQGLSDKRKMFTLERGTGEEQLYFIQVSCTTLFGAGKNGMINAPDKDQVYTLSSAHVFTRNNAAYACYVDLKVLHELARDSSDDSSLCYDALYTANDIINILTKADYTANPVQPYLKSHDIAKQFFNSGGNARDTIHAIGNCHIDCAWLWPVDETKRKVARSWASTASIINSGSRFNFAASQVVQFQWMKDLYPELYTELKKLITQGNFNPVGGTWVEMDTNIPSGESMIRQFLYGQQFYQKEFGVKSEILWLPDTFGYSGQLPQIMKLCDVKYFLSQKLSWNLTNSFPHHTFYWKGIDGSKILSHFPPCDSYESKVEVKDILKSVKNNKDKGRNHNQMLLFGHGDGGGGPTPEMIERLRRLENVGDLPKVIRSSPDKFFASIEKEGTDRLCEWWGELYFELHRGTYTTWGKVKEENRRCELKMRELEMKAVNTHFFTKDIKISKDEIKERIAELWKLVLFNQFHDILPGTSIGQAFVDACNDYEKFHIKWQELYDFLVSSAKRPNIPTEHHVVNPYSWAVSQVVEHEGKLFMAEAPGLYVGLADLRDYEVWQQCSPVSSKLRLEETKNGYVMENENIRAIFSHSGALTSVVQQSVDSDKTRECLSGPGNSFVIFDDIPLFWDAWDVMEYHTETKQEYPPTKAYIKTTEGLRVCLLVTVPLGEHGHAEVEISLDREAKFLKFKANVNWKANRKFLKVEFPLSFSAMEATYDIQSGCLKRPTHKNTSWDMAKFEVSGHKWANLSEPNFGVSLLSKSKYGYSATPNSLTLSLLRSSKSPDDTADMGSHEIVYGLMPHKGPLTRSGVVKESYALSHPLEVRPGFAAVNELFRFTIDEGTEDDKLVVQAVKVSEDGLSVILRLYEPYGNTVDVEFATLFPFKQGKFVNAVERELQQPLNVSQSDQPDMKMVKLTLRPFEIRSIRFELCVDATSSAKRSVEPAKGSLKMVK